MSKIITEVTATSLEAFFKKHIQAIVEKADLNLVAVSVGGKFNREGILVELGFMPKGVSPEDCAAFIVERQGEGHDVSQLNSKEGKSKLSKIAERIDKPLKLVKQLSSALDDDLKVGDAFVHKGATYILVGYSVKKKMFVLFNKKTNVLRTLEPKAFYKLEPKH